jgi:hypothetical protein
MREDRQCQVKSKPWLEKSMEKKGAGSRRFDRSILEAAIANQAITEVRQRQANSMQWIEISM